MSGARQERGQRLWALFTDENQLTDAQANHARAEGRRIVNPTERQRKAQDKRWNGRAVDQTPKPKQRAFDPAKPTPKQRAFAQQGHDHLTVYFIFSEMTAKQASRLREAMAQGDPVSDWPWPMTHADAIMRRLSWNDRQEAWRLFGEGGKP